MNDGGPAFPGVHWMHTHGQETHAHDGLSLRDYFAAAALQGMLANPQCRIRGTGKPAEPEDLVSGSYTYADHMLAERSKS